MRYLGIDPGVSGGLACLDEDGSVIEVQRMPETDGDLLAMIVMMRGDAAQAMLERVRSSPRMGSSAAFTFGQGYGRLRMALLACGVPFAEVMPRRWQMALGCHMAGLGKFGERDDVAAKNHTKGYAQSWFPRVKVTHAVADALLIAEYARRLGRGMITTVVADGGGRRGQTRARRKEVNASLGF